MGSMRCFGDEGSEYFSFRPTAVWLVVYFHNIFSESPIEKFIPFQTILSIQIYLENYEFFIWKISSVLREYCLVLMSFTALLDSLTIIGGKQQKIKLELNYCCRPSAILFFDAMSTKRLFLFHIKNKATCLYSIHSELSCFSFEFEEQTKC